MLDLFEEERGSEGVGHGNEGACEWRTQFVELFILLPGDKIEM